MEKVSFVFTIIDKKTTYSSYASIEQMDDTQTNRLLWWPVREWGWEWF